MADETKKVPEAPAPAPELHPDGAPILKGAAATQFWPTEEKAIAIARGRVKGARLAYTVKSPDGKVRYATATHRHFLMEYILEVELKYVTLDIGKPPSTKAPASAASIMALIDMMPEAEREAVKKQLEALPKPKK